MPENVEIERRFLVDGRFERPWVHESTTCIEIKQWYLDHKRFNVSVEQNAVVYKNKQLVSGLSKEVCSTLLEEPEWTVRIRKSHSAFLLTLKGSRKGACAAEFEWEIERDTAESVVDDSMYPFVEKKRYLWINTDGFVWEIDEFESNLAGLIIAEVELEDEDATVEIPSWA
ncbi:MAG: CYTH domain-containing protein, partial [Candidatus Thermoplasmatota archaeon]|nr:CYTH domain-containing protein [Candidatus Thermoplasmatota archaeon]